MTVYRKPGSGLDSVLRREITGVTLRLIDSKLSHEEMLAALQKATGDDRGYWQKNGVAVRGGTPLPDGSGIEIFTVTGKQSDAAALSRHYGFSVKVRKWPRPV
jgi:hypothetical protein